jgi:hypothetical protein
VRRVNWTIVAISAGVTLGVSVAVLSTDGSSVPQASGLIVPQSAPSDDEVHSTPSSPSNPVIPPVVDVVTVTAAGYTQSLTPPPPPLVAVNAAVSIKPLPLVRNVVNKTTIRATSIVSQILGGSSSSWSGWFGTGTSSSTSLVSQQSNNSLSTLAAQQSSGSGRHRADGSGGSRQGGGGGGGRSGGGGGHRCGHGGGGR